MSVLVNLPTVYYTTGEESAPEQGPKIKPSKRYFLTSLAAIIYLSNIPFGLKFHPLLIPRNQKGQIIKKKFENLHFLYSLFLNA